MKSKIYKQTKDKLLSSKQRKKWTHKITQFCWWSLEYVD